MSPEETHHLKNVLRISIGDQCILSDGRGHEFLSRVERFLNDGRSELMLLKSACREGEGRIKILAAQAIPQRGKMDDIAEKAAELGIFTLIPVLTERTIVRPKAGQAKKMHSRWEKIAGQTVKQSQASRVPIISEPVHFQKLWSGAFSFDQAFLFHPDPKAVSLRTLDVERLRDLERILLVIGPEGGFSPEEIQTAWKAEAQIIQMGCSTLKTDTAFVAAVSFFQTMLGE